MTSSSSSATDGVTVTAQSSSFSGDLISGHVPTGAGGNILYLHVDTTPVLTVPSSAASPTLFHMGVSVGTTATVAGATTFNGDLQVTSRSAMPFGCAFISLPAQCHVRCILVHTIINIFSARTSYRCECMH